MHCMLVSTSLPSRAYELVQNAAARFLTNTSRREDITHRTLLTPLASSLL